MRAAVREGSAAVRSTAGTTERGWRNEGRREDPAADGSVRRNESGRNEGCREAPAVDGPAAAAVDRRDHRMRAAE